MEASLDWKPNGHTVPGPGIEPELSGPQHGGSTTTLPASPVTSIAWRLLSGVAAEEPQSPAQFLCFLESNSWINIEIVLFVTHDI